MVLPLCGTRTVRCSRPFQAAPFDGPRKGQQLKPIATLRTTWGYWNKAYPGSVAYRMFEKYQPVELSRQGNADSKQTRGPADRRLPENEDVLGVSAGGHWKAYPLNAMPKNGGVIRDTLAGQRHCRLLVSIDSYRWRLCDTSRRS